MMKYRTALAFEKLKSNPRYSLFFAIFCKYLFTYIHLITVLTYLHKEFNKSLSKKRSCFDDIEFDS